MSIQILQYEFLGPVKLDEWGPPMEKVVFLIFSRLNDSFKIIYVGDCEKTEQKDFFENNPNFQNWIQTTGSKNSLYVAILPMFESNSSARQVVIHKILRTYHPVCNTDDIKEKKPDYVIRSKLEDSSKIPKNLSETREKISCPCCGQKM
ncbi:MAG: hypothetical protein OEL77_06370, partial [Nitrosopumilus sp.]|nr:hypothetical protein [Nitrosopumilus sp.]